MEDYKRFSHSFTQIRAEDIRDAVEAACPGGRLWLAARYVLDPADVHGKDHPSETFRVFKSNQMRRFGEYHTARLVLEAWDWLAGVEVAA